MEEQNKLSQEPAPQPNFVPPVPPAPQYAPRPPVPFVSDAHEKHPELNRKESGTCRFNRRYQADSVGIALRRK